MFPHSEISIARKRCAKGFGLVLRTAHVQNLRLPIPEGSMKYGNTTRNTSRVSAKHSPPVHLEVITGTEVIWTGKSKESWTFLGVLRQGRPKTYWYRASCATPTISLDSRYALLFPGRATHYSMLAYDEETPLLASSRTLPYASQATRSDPENIHLQFCSLAGVPPSTLLDKARQPAISRRSLYGRAVHKRNAQNRMYLLTASLSNTLLLSQVVLGAALTGLGASGSSHILITVFGALNTIIAGVVAYLKSRGQPMRARMYRDDLDRVVDEIENSEVMWLGIQSGVHGYDEIAIDDSISVRSEVARLTRLYDKVVKNNTMNDRRSNIRPLEG